MNIPGFPDAQAAARRIARWTHRTPVLTSSTLDRLTGARLLFKCENLQKAGAFKARGATNAVFTLDDAQAAHGVVTHSSGNHALALARAAHCRGIPCTVVMPENANAAKRQGVARYGGQVISCAPTLRAREQTLQALVARTGGHFVHPYDDSRVIAGQATCALELHEQAGPLDTVIAPVSGGGLISGTALALGELAPATRIYGAEPANADDAHRSLHAGHIIPGDAPETIADGLRASLSPLTWHFVSRQVADVLLVTEAEIITAMRRIWEIMKLVVEPSSAVALAAVLKAPERFHGQRVGLILTGGNVDLDALPWRMTL